MAAHQLAEELLQQNAHGFDVGGQLAAADFFGHGEGGAAGQGVAAEGAGVLPGLEVIHRGCHGEGANGEAPAQPLGQGDGIGLDPQLLVAPQAAAAAHTHLHLIEDQQDVLLAAKLPHPLEEGGVAGVDPPFALEGFEHDGGHPGAGRLTAAEQGLEGGDVVVGEVLESLHHGLKALVVFGLAGCRDGGEGASVEAGLGGENNWRLSAGAADAPGDAAMLAGQFDRGLVGFGAGIAEEHRVGAAVGRDPGGELLLLRDPVEVGDVLEFAQLPAQLAAHDAAAVAQGADGDAGDAVEVALAVLIPHPHTPAPNQFEGEAPVGVHHRRLGGGLPGWRHDGSGGTRTHKPEGVRF